MERGAYILAIILVIIGLVLSGAILILELKPKTTNQQTQSQPIIIYTNPQQKTETLKLPFPECLLSHDVTLYLPDRNWDNQFDMLGDSRAYISILDCSRYHHHHSYRDRNYRLRYDWNYDEYCPAENYPIWKIDGHTHRGTFTPEELSMLVCN